MAFIRYATVRERCMAALVDRLLTIRRINGYNTDISYVKITRAWPPPMYEENTLYIIVENSAISQDATAKYYEYVNISIGYYCGRIDEDFKDMESNLILGDIQRALHCDLTDPTHPVPSATGVYLAPGEYFPNYNQPGTNDIVGICKYTMEFYYSINDNRLWDDEADNLVEIED